MKYHSHLSGWLVLKKQKITNVGKNMKKSEHLCIVGKNVNWSSPYGKQYEGPAKMNRIGPCP